MYKLALAPICLGALLAIGCGNPVDEDQVNFSSEGAQIVRQRVCTQNWATATHKGSGAESYNATLIWSVSPYQVLVPSTGSGYVQVNVDAPHYDWLLYTKSDVTLSSQGGPALKFNGAVKECPELGLVEYGAHHQELTQWPVRIDGAKLSRAQFYAGLAATEHSDPNEAGHAGHDLNGDGTAPDHGGH